MYRNHCKKVFLLVLLVFFFTPAFLTAGRAENPAPPYVPLVTPDSLEEITFAFDGTGYFVCGDQKSLSDCDITGFYWKFFIPWHEEEKGTAELKTWLNQQKITTTIEKDREVYAHIAVSEIKEYYFRFATGVDGVTCEISRKMVLRPDHPLRFQLDEDTPLFYFYTRHDGKQSQSLDLAAKNLKKGTAEDYCEISLGADFKSIQGKLTHDIHFVHSLSNIEGNEWEVPNIPQFPGHYAWSVQQGSGEPVGDMEIRLSRGLSLPGLISGDTLGGLLVKNVPYGAATAVPEYGDSFSFPGFYESSYIADVTPKGDALFWLPPGMWTIQVDPGESDSFVSHLESHFIPVQPGHMTRLEWPKSLNEAFSTGEAHKLKIVSAQAEAEKGWIDISLLGSDRTRVEPSAEKLEVIESGQKGNVTRVERIKTPADIVLLLDSSGSMKGRMQQAISSVKTFLGHLPGGTKIRIIDFDTLPRLLKGTTAGTVLKSLKSVRANGATALYDTILEGLSLFENADRPALLVFTDGVDANHNDTGPGSRATQEDVLKAVQETDIPVFTIGFGDNSDVNTLSRISEISGGDYYVAGNEADLNNIFDRINSNLGSQYRISYERPKISSAGNRPVMSIMVDNSGSMDSWPDECGGCDKRLEKTRQILKRFVLDLPDDFLIQIATFSGDVIVNQVLTDDKLAALRAIAMMKARSTTDILGSVETALKTLKSVPSNQRYLVYIADLALEVDDDEIEAFDAVLGKIKDAKIATLFIGMVDEDENNAFAHAAEMTGGISLVSTDFEKVAETFQEMAGRIKGVPDRSDKTTLRVALAHRSREGKNRIFSAAKEVMFPKPSDSGEIAEPEFVVLKPGYPLKPYDPALANLLSGTDVMMKDVRIIKRMPLDTTGGNKAAQIRLTEALSLSRLRKIDAPDNLRFYALTLTFENILPKQNVAIYPDGSNHPAAWVGGSDVPLRYEERVPTYVIPDVQKHIFLRWNNERSLPVSEATWLAQTPLTLPGDEALSIDADQPVTGTLIFMVPTQHMKQASLHLYDTNWGHIDLPISGTMEITGETMEKLPEKPPVKLSDTFSLEVKGTRIKDKIDIIEAGENMKFLVLDADFQSNMQAHIDIKPRERFKFKLPTDTGSFFFNVHSVTKLLPLGFFRPVMITPGSKNPVRMAFRIPEAFIDQVPQGSLVVDIAGGGITIPLSDASGTDEYKGGYDASGQGLSVKIINTGTMEEILNVGSNLMVVEALISDTKDNHHTGIGELIVLKNKKFDPVIAAATQKEIDRLRREAATLPNRGLANFGQTTLKVIPGMLAPVASRDTLLFGMDEETVIPDGHTRRGLFFFQIPPDTPFQDWTISSLVIPDLSKEPVDQPFEDTGLFVTTLDDEDEAGNLFWEAMETAVSTLTARREATGFKKPGSLLSKRIDLDQKQEKGAGVPPISITAPARDDVNGIKDLTQLREKMRNIRFLPSTGYGPWMVRYAPDAVLTQGWGTESDIAELAETVLSKMGFKSTRISVEMTDKGKAALTSHAGGLPHSISKLPALRYSDDNGSAHVLVAPYLKDISELAGQVILKQNAPDESDAGEKADITIDLIVKPTGNASLKQLSDASDALSGSDSDESTLTILSHDFQLSDLSKDAVDIGYTKSLRDGGMVLQAVLDGPEGRQISSRDYWVSLKDYTVVGETIMIRTENDTFTRTRYLDKNMDLTGVFHTIGINLPDLPKEKAETLEIRMAEKQADVQGKPDALSTLKWYTRKVLYRFIAAQTQNEKETGETLDVVTGRVHNIRCLMVTVQKDTMDSPLKTSMDLLYPHAQILSAPDEPFAHAFNIMTGMANVKFEATALGREGYGFFDIIEQCPKDTTLLPVDESNLSEFVRILTEKKYPRSIIDRISNLSGRVVFFPSSPAVINDQLRWAWLEFNTSNYQLVSVLDSGENGSMVEKFIGNIYEQAASYMIGAFIGVDSSIWAVSAISLEEDDYKKIIKKAKAFVTGLSNRFGVGGKIRGISYGVGIGGSPGVGVGRIGSYSISPSGLTPGNGLGGFGNGFKDGAEYYFSKAR